MADRRTWAPVPEHRRADVVDVANALLMDCDHGLASDMADSLVIETRGGRQTICYSAGKSRLRIMLRPDAPAVETRTIGERAMHRELSLPEVLELEWSPRQDGE